MELLKPFTVDFDTLVSNVVDDEYPAWVGGPHDTGDRVIYEERVWESAVDSNSDDPIVGEAKDPKTWLFVGPSNRYAMFDTSNSTKTTNADEIDVTNTFENVYGAVALFEVAAAEVQIIATDSAAVEVFNETFPMRSDIGVSDWYTYFFSPIRFKSSLFVRLPPFSGDIQAIITAPSGDVEVGSIVYGTLSMVGITDFGGSGEIVDFSRRTTDQFGNTTLTRRASARRNDMILKVNSEDTEYALSELDDVRSTPTVFVGEETHGETILFGFYRSARFIHSNYAISTFNVQVESLV